MKQVAEYLQEAEVRYAGGDLNSLRHALGVDGPDVDMRVLLNESLVGFLKEVQEEEGKTRLELAKVSSEVRSITVFEELCPRSTDYIIKIVGKKGVKRCPSPVP